MSLKPDASVMAGLATVALVIGVYSAALPTLADERAISPDADDLRAAENQALWLGVAASAAVSLIAADPTPFILGGATACVLAWYHRHARLIDPATGQFADWLGQSAKISKITTVETP